MKLTNGGVEREILVREANKGKDLNVSQVRTALRHFWQIISEGDDSDIDAFVKNRVSYYRKKVYKERTAVKRTVKRYKKK